MRAVIFLLIACGLFAPACSDLGGGGEISRPIKNSKSYNVDGAIVLLGDSIARGVGAINQEKALQGCFDSSSDQEVYTYARDGGTTEDSMDLLKMASESKPSLTLVSLGGNDVVADAIDNNFPEELTLKNIRTIFKSLTEAGSLVIHLGLNPPTNPDFPLDTSRLTAIKSVAAEEGVIFLDSSFSGMWGNTDYMSDDIHPNDKGYSVLCDRVKKALGPHFTFKK